jgi:superfamily II DNA or RNA helicase
MTRPREAQEVAKKGKCESSTILPFLQINAKLVPEVTNDLAAKRQKMRQESFSSTAIGCTYRISKQELGANIHTHIKKLTLCPIENFSKETHPFPAYEVDEDFFYVPKFYGVNTWGQARLDQSTEGELIDVKFKGTLSCVQRECTDTFHEMVKSSGTSPCGGIVVLPCGYGKTVYALHMIACMKRKTLVLVHKNFLVEQWTQRAKQFLPGVSIGMIQQNVVKTDADVVVGMVQSISKREYDAEIFKQFGLVIIDEAHHMAARVFSQALLKIPAKYTLALSATPERKDGMTDLLKWSMGEIIYRVKREQEQVNITSLVFETSKPKIIINKEGRVNWALMVNSVSKNERRNRLILKYLLGYIEEGRKIIIMSDRVEQLKLLSAMIDESGIAASKSFYIGTTSAKERESAEEKDILLTTYSMSREALDIPALDTLIMATPVGDIEQVVGRILRKHPDKKTPLVLDIIDPYSIFDCMRWKRRGYYASQNYTNCVTTVPESV